LSLAEYTVIWKGRYIGCGQIGACFFGGLDQRLGYWGQRADERLGNPRSPRYIRESLVVTDRDERPLRGPVGGALLLRLAVVRCLERDFLCPVDLSYNFLESCLLCMKEGDITLHYIAIMSLCRVISLFFFLQF